MSRHVPVRSTPGGVTRLYLLRSEQGLRQEDLAAMADTHAPRISLIERGKAWPTEREIRGLARAFGLTVGAITDLADEARRQARGEERGAASAPSPAQPQEATA